MSFSLLFRLHWARSRPPNDKITAGFIVAILIESFLNWRRRFLATEECCNKCGCAPRIAFISDCECVVGGNECKEMNSQRSVCGGKTANGKRAKLKQRKRFEVVLFSLGFIRSMTLTRTRCAFCTRNASSNYLHTSDCRANTATCQVASTLRAQVAKRERAKQCSHCVSCAKQSKSPHCACDVRCRATQIVPPYAIEMRETMTHFVRSRFSFRIDQMNLPRSLQNEMEEMDDEEGLNENTMPNANCRVDKPFWFNSFQLAQYEQWRNGNKERYDRATNDKWLCGGWWLRHPTNKKTNICWKC